MEKELAKQIRELIEKGPHKTVEISAATFAKMWRNDTIPKLMQFSKANGFDYVIIIQGNRMVGIRFWKIKGKYLLGESNELSD